MRDDEIASDPLAQDRFARLLTGVAPVPGVGRMRPPGPDASSGGPLEGPPGNGYGAPDDRVRLGARGAFDGPVDDVDEDRRRRGPSADLDASLGASPSARAVAALGAFSPGRRAMKPLIAVAVCVAMLAAFIAWRSRPSVHPVAPVVPSVSSAAAPVATEPVLPTTGSPSPGPSGSPTLIIVAVQGRVRHPGLVRLPAGARVADAIGAAGGVLPGTDTSYVNLAEKVTDGQLIVVAKSGPLGGSGPVAGGPGAGDPSGVGGGSGQPINLNTATAADLDSLPGIGPALAQKIIDYRTQHGAFHSVDELRNVSGIGDAKFADIKDLVTV